MGPGPAQDKQLRAMKLCFSNWRKANNNKTYVKVRDICEAEVEDRMGGAGSGSKPKKLTKQAFAGSMDKLTTSLESLHAALKGESIA